MDADRKRLTRSQPFTPEKADGTTKNRKESRPDATSPAGLRARLSDDYGSCETAPGLALCGEPRRQTKGRNHEHDPILENRFGARSHPVGFISRCCGSETGILSWRGCTA